MELTEGTFKTKYGTHWGHVQRFKTRYGTHGGHVQDKIWNSRRARSRQDTTTIPALSETRNASMPLIELSKYIWKLKESDVQYSTKWKIIEQCWPYSNKTKRCNLCLYEKFIICHPRTNFYRHVDTGKNTCGAINNRSNFNIYNQLFTTLGVNLNHILLAWHHPCNYRPIQFQVS